MDEDDEGGGFQLMTGGLEMDLLEALKELLASSEALASGETPTSEECDRYDVAADRARRVISRAEPT